MPDKNIHITEQNLTEWMRSTGYLLPQIHIEVQRFEILHAGLHHQVDFNAVDPFAIINGTFSIRTTINLPLDDVHETIEGFRMAARKHQQLPDELLGKMKKNHHKKNGSDPSQNLE